MEEHPYWELVKLAHRDDIDNVAYAAVLQLSTTPKFAKMTLPEIYDALLFEARTTLAPKREAENI